MIEAYTMLVASAVAYYIGLNVGYRQTMRFLEEVLDDD